jgi:hypothetical protein
MQVAGPGQVPNPPIALRPRTAARGHAPDVAVGRSNHTALPSGWGGAACGTAGAVPQR